MLRSLPLLPLLLLLPAFLSLAGCGEERAKAPGPPNRDALFDPWLAREQAPDVFRVKFETTRGDIVFEIRRDWAPQGADRFFNLVRIGYFDDVAFFRVLPAFVAQFGIHGDPRVNAAWRQTALADDPVKTSNVRGTLSFATGGPNTRTTQLFINLGHNTNLDAMGFSPIGKVIEGMPVAAKLFMDYGEAASRVQDLIQYKGNDFLKQKFPKLDYIKQATVLE